MPLLSFRPTTWPILHHESCCIHTTTIDNTSSTAMSTSDRGSIDDIYSYNSSTCHYKEHRHLQKRLPINRPQQRHLGLHATTSTRAQRRRKDRIPSLLPRSTSPSTSRSLVITVIIVVILIIFIIFIVICNNIVGTYTWSSSTRKTVAQRAFSAPSAATSPATALRTRASFFAFAQFRFFFCVGRCTFFLVAALLVAL